MMCVCVCVCVCVCFCTKGAERHGDTVCFALLAAFPTTLSHNINITLTHPHSHTHTHSRALSLSHTHTHTHTHTHRHTLTLFVISNSESCCLVPLHNDRKLCCLVLREKKRQPFCKNYTSCCIQT